MIGEKTLGLKLAARIDEYAAAYAKQTHASPQSLAPQQVRLVEIVLRTIAQAIRDVVS